MRRYQAPWIAWVLAAVALAAFTAVAGAQRTTVPAQKGTAMRGHIVRVPGPDHFVVRTVDNREVILHTNPQTKFLLNDRVARFADLREGIEINAVYDVAGEQNLASSVTIAQAAVPAEEIVEGTVVRVVEPDNQLVIRTVEGKEVIVVAEDRTTFTFDNRAARLVDFRPGTAVRVNVDVRDRKHMARTVVTVPKRSR